MFATLHTTAGDIRIELLPNHAPKTVANFVGLAKGTTTWSDPRTGAERTEPFYDGLIFHRVVPDFVIQGGDPRGDGFGGPGYDIRDEINPLRYRRGVAGMALAGPDTGGSQFFITHSPQPHLDGAYTVFGEVVSGRDVVERILPGDRIVRVTEITDDTAQ